MILIEIHGLGDNLVRAKDLEERIWKVLEDHPHLERISVGQANTIVRNHQQEPAPFLRLHWTGEEHTNREGVIPRLQKLERTHGLRVDAMGQSECSASPFRSG
jgi:hypothetical protein